MAALSKRNIREEQLQFEMLDRDLHGGTASADQRAALEARRPRDLLIEKRRKAQDDWFDELGLQEYFFRIGQEPRQLADAWTNTVAVMHQYGMHDVRAAANYGTPVYLRANPIALMVFKHQLGSFEVDPEGQVVLPP